MKFDWKAPDGLLLPCEKWEAEGAPRAVIVCVHGLSGSPQEFAPVGARAVAHGMSVYSISVRGQGNDPRLKRRGAELDMEAIGKDLASFSAMAKNVAGGAPLFLCGESMGALIAMHVKTPPGVEGIVFSAPVVDMRRRVTPLTRNVVEFLRWAVPFVRIRPSLFVSGGKRHRITRNEAYVHELRSRDSQIRTFTIKFLCDLGERVYGSSEAARRVETPCLVLAGGNDCFVSTEQVERWFGELGSVDKTMKIYPESYHLLWHDWDHEVVLGDIIHWVESRL